MSNFNIDRAWIEAQVRPGPADTLGPKSVTWKYRFSILFVACVMILLPILYLCFIGLVVYGTYYHAIHHTFLIENKNGQLSRLVVVYLLPLILSPILVLFLIKPLFATRSNTKPSQSLTAQDEPLLFALVERLCQVTRAPMPTRIDINCDVNAYASFNRGLSSFYSNDLVLTLGLSLIAALQLSQFAGVLAHELGHFNQGLGMRLSFVIRSISAWFTRVVYERDSWDERLLKIAYLADFKIGYILFFAYWMIWLTRCILWCFMMVGHFFSALLLRQMEFDADRHEIHLAGSQNFEKTCRQLLQLNLASEGAYADLNEFHREGKLADNIPRYIASLTDQIPDELQAKIDEHLRLGKTGLFDTHPTEKDRIARARQENAPETFRYDTAASDLFTDFDTLCQKSTYLLYRETFGAEFSATSVRPYEELLEQSNHQFETRKALQRYFLECYSPLRLIEINDALAIDCSQPERILEALTAARSTMLSARLNYIEHYTKFENLYSKQLELHQVFALQRAGLQLDPNQFSVPVQNKQALKFDTELKEKLRHAEDRMSEFEQAIGTRLFAASALLTDPQAEAGFEDVQATISDCQRSQHMLQILNQSFPDLLAIRSELSMVAALVYNRFGREKDRKLNNELTARLQQLHKCLMQVQTQAQQFSYPFDHAEGDVSLDRYLIKSVPGADDIEGLQQTAATFLDNWLLLYNRLSANIVHISEQVEACFGLEPITLPKPSP